MPRPTTPSLTPFTEQLPDVNSPSTWATRTPLFWNWVTGPGYENLADLLGYSESAIDFIDGALAGSETLIDAVSVLQSEISRMTGMIVMWSGSIASIPFGWALCNGANGTPDLRDRFIVGAGSDYAVGATGGADSVTLTEAQMPAHSHAVNINTNTAGAHTHSVTLMQSSSFGSGSSAFIGQNNAGTSTNVASVDSQGSHAHNVSGSTSSAGSGSSHENRPPYYALAYIMKL